MSQQINLFNPALVKQKDPYNAALMARLAVVVLMAMLAAHAYEKHQVDQLQKQREQAVQLMQQTRQQLVDVTRQFGPRQPSKALQDELVATEAKLQAHEKILAYLQNGRTNGGAGFSNYMRAFARQSTNGLWLTGFSFDTGADDLTIRGRTLQPELVPQYIARLGAEAALKGRSFAALDMGQPKVEPAGKEAAPANAAQPAYIEFTLQSHIKQEEAKVQMAEKKS